MKKVISNLLLAVCIVVFLFSGWKLVGYYLEYKKADDEYDKIAQEVVKTKGKERIIDFEKLRKINPDTIGWVYAKGTNIDYPVVLGKDNDYYLHTTFEGTKNSSGAVFMDCHGDKDFGAAHNIIYGPHMRSGSMFADLMKFREQSFIKKQDTITLYTPNGKRDLKVVASYARKADKLIPITFGDRKDMKKYLEEILSMSDIQSKIPKKTVMKTKKLYTFVTCSYEQEDNRTFVHAIESKD